MAISAGRIDRDLRLRIAETADQPRLFAWYRQALRAPIEALQGWNDDDRRADFRRLSAHIPTFVIVHDEIDVGLIQVWPRQDVLHLVNIAIVESARGIGIGRRVLNWLKTRALEAGLGMHLKVLRTNPSVLDFYRDCGFEIQQTSQEYWWLGWRYRESPSRADSID